MTVFLAFFTLVCYYVFYAILVNPQRLRGKPDPAMVRTNGADPLSIPEFPFPRGRKP